MTLRNNLDKIPYIIINHIIYHSDFFQSKTEGKVQSRFKAIWKKVNVLKEHYNKEIILEI